MGKVKLKKRAMCMKFHWGGYTGRTEKGKMFFLYNKLRLL